MELCASSSRWKNSHPSSGRLAASLGSSRPRLRPPDACPRATAWHHIPRMPRNLAEDSRSAEIDAQSQQQCLLILELRGSQAQTADSLHIPTQHAHLSAKCAQPKQSVREAKNAEIRNLTYCTSRIVPGSTRDQLSGFGRRHLADSGTFPTQPTSTEEPRGLIGELVNIYIMAACMREASVQGIGLQQKQTKI